MVFDRIRPLDDRRQNVGDELHRPIAYRHAAIDAQARHGNPGIRRHRFDEIARLVADGLEVARAISGRPHSAVNPISAPRARGTQ